MFLGVRLEDIVRWAGVSPSHARLVKTGIRKPSLQVQRLVTLHDGGQVLRGRWEGWRCRGDKLVSPEGVQFDASALEHHRLVLQFARELAAQSGGGAYERFWELLA